MDNLKKVGFAALCLLLPLTLSAHQEALDNGWCAGGQITVLGQFSLTAPVLSKFKGKENAVCNQVKSCGQFDDDDYTAARRAADAYCHQLSEVELENSKTSSDNGTVRPVFHAPAVVKHAELRHHELYSVNQGLSFSCGVCRLKVAATPVTVSK
jgi:hypothetical protein